MYFLEGKLSKVQDEDAQNKTNIQVPQKLWWWKFKRCCLQTSTSNGKLIQKILLNQKCMGYSLIQKLRGDQKCMKKVVPSSRSKATKDIISIRNFMEVLVLNHYVLVRKILGKLSKLHDEVAQNKTNIQEPRKPW
ncbi:hypothetical protein Tco_0840859 [Tanacetum coccineum]|uniref:Uncharacterized protein n=1 Tax=Tanacetum coccineum TaxID=301880 RepID=A0ABQ5AXG1_9ASTR